MKPEEEKRPPITQGLPLSRGQEALYHVHRMAPGSPVYNVGFSFVIHAEIHVPAMRDALRALMRRHASLRVSFGTGKSGESIQHIHDDPPLDFEEIDASAWVEGAIESRVEAAHLRPFDLETPPLFRARLFTRSREKHLFLLSIHHTIVDGWSSLIILDELERLYFARVNDTGAKLPPIPAEYTDFIREQDSILDSPEGERLQQYWREQLSGDLPVLDLPIDRSRPPVQTFNGAACSFRLSEPLTEGIRTLAKAEKVTPFILLLAAWQTFLHRYTGQDDILVASPVMGRFHRKFHDVVGYFVNPIVLRADLSGAPSFRDFLARVRKKFFEAMRHQHYPFASLFKTLRLKRDPGYPPIAQATFVLLKPEIRPGFGELATGGRTLWAGMAVEDFELMDQGGREDLQLEIVETQRFFSGRLLYNTDLFEHATIERMAGHFQVLLQGIISDPEQGIGVLPLLTEAERQRILVEWNDTAAPYPKDKCVHELFEEQVARDLDAVAVVFEDEEVSYGELNDRANRLAHRLRALGVGPEMLVGLFVERSVEMVVGLLAILKAGGAYVPLDPEYPLGRLAFMAEDADLKVLLCHGATRKQLPECAARILDMDGEAEGIAGESSNNPVQLADPNNLAYVIYTSGSTGKPKGVAMPHAALVNLLSWQRSQFYDSGRHVVLQFAPLSFDVSFQDIFSTLHEGSTLVLIENEARKDFTLLIDHLCANKVDRIFLPFIALQSLASISNSVGKVLSLKEVITAGEQLQTTKGIRTFFARLPDCTLYNHYGPTETHVVSSYTLEGSTSEWSELPPIGSPITNIQLYILDDQKHPVPIGVPGELYIGGAGVARGYLNRPDLTAERFIPDSFSDEPGARLYRTGDSCRWLPDGNIEFLGRIDTQVKIRGFRIELGEVENALLSHPDVREAVVDARGDSADKQLVAWVGWGELANPNTDVSGNVHVGVRSPPQPTHALRTHLRALLPDWMIPSRFVFVETLPLTPSGKIDRRALPDADRHHAGTEYIAPRTSAEGTLCNIFAEVLSVERVGIHGDFFALGGHSLLATRVIASIGKRIGVELPLRALFEHPTPAGLANAIRDRKAWEPNLIFPFQTVENTPKPPLFCIHPMWGGVFCYQELADCLDADQPVYGIQAVGFEGNDAPLTDIGAMVTRYVEEITKIYPEGPCNLYGWSFGGLVAFEVAHALRAQNREVTLLALGDTVSPLQILCERPKEREEDEILFHVLMGIDRGHASLFAELRDLTPSERRRRLREQATHESERASFGDIERFIHIYRANLRSFPSTYRPTPWEGAIVLLTAAEQEAVDTIGMRAEPDMWRPLAGEVHHHMVSGQHLTMHGQPHVSGIGEILTGYLATQA
uniref:Amino acid adenylation domain-containing protein n=1 Tax=Candidatus Kentrum sp. FW TaxID=2126338 RepID=A0A450TVS9_9GAMM|nr:MAG: amino acid adenylation domain-containing protein [Candidatus Kentron sp. FW]